MSSKSDVTALVLIGDRWYMAKANQPPNDPPLDFALVRSGDVLRSGAFASLGGLLGFTREMVEVVDDAVRLLSHYKADGTAEALEALSPILEAILDVAEAP